MMESIEKLRELCAKWRKTSITPGRNPAADEVDKIADEIEREIAEKYMLLPVDCENKPIHIGDVMDEGKVAKLVISDDGEHSVYVYKLPNVQHEFYCYETAHKPRTVEDVLRDLVNDAEWEQSPDSYEEIERRLITLYTAELRELMEVDG